ncbi:MFS family permease [Paucibacter oligotrophus]|uniref:Multidrug efflux pump Tap n=1 Tax=Roseateles oligotrophus TaxID=1769250 RepID=A0A840LDN5_9BURK|nr:MFS transporter [Roseateles oligotrophus]MBB4844179.1 MFS family permease [Roseateles oligotrophus]
MLKSLDAKTRSLGLPFRGLLLSEAMTILAMMVGHVALPWWIVGHGGAAHLALYGVVAAISALCFTPLLSPLGDRLPKPRLIRLGLGLQLGLALCLALLASSGLYQLHWILLVSVLGALGGALMAPASMSIAAELVPAPDLPQALSLQRSAQSLGRILGPALAGAALSLGTAWALWLQCGLIAGAIWAVSAIPAISAEQHRASRKSWLGDLSQGLRAAWQIPTERAWTLVSLLSTCCLLPGITLLVPLKIKAMGLSGAWLGAAEAGLALGMLLGALGVAAWVSRHIGRYTIRIAATVVQGLGLLLAGWTEQGLLLVAALALVGVANSCGVLVGQSHRMLAIPPEFRSRLNAVSMMSLQLAASLGPALTGLALSKYTVSQVYMGIGLAAALSSLGFFWVPGLREMFAQDHEQVRGWYGHKHPHLFTDAIQR